MPFRQLKSILAREACHVRRRDNLTAAMHMIAEALFWFHPAVWWIEHHLIEERELACDEAVLRLGNEARVYAESILKCLQALHRTSHGLCIWCHRFGVETTHPSDLDKPDGTGLGLGTQASALSRCDGSDHDSCDRRSVRSAEVHAQTTTANQESRAAATWQGTLHTDRDYRFVIEIEGAIHTSSRGTFYNLDGRPGGTPATQTTLVGIAEDRPWLCDLSRHDERGR